MASNASADDAIRLLLRKVAHLHYSKLSADGRALVRQAFFGLDDSADGRISLSEFLAATSSTTPDSARVISRLFAYVDEDQSGHLEFDEYLVFTYMVQAGLRLCDACLQPVVLVGYTCRTCFSQRASPDSDTYDLCGRCYASNHFSHPSDHDIVDMCIMYHSLVSAASPQALQLVQCCKCGDFHNKDAKSTLVDGRDHIMESEESPGKFICEWCSTWLCNNCGKFFPGLSTSATRMKWLKKDLHCVACGVDGNKTNLEALFKDLKNDKICQQCNTCAFKIQEEILWENVSIPTTSSTTLSDPLTATMAQALEMQQALFLAQSMANMGAAISRLAG